MKLNTFFDLCSGIGGGRLGLVLAGLSPVGYSDTSRLSSTTYKLMFGAENERNILENVKGLVSHDKGNTLKTIVNLLNEAGFDVVYKVLTSLEYGVPQMRQRIYFIGVNRNTGIKIENFEWPEKQHRPALESFLVDEHPISDWMLEYLPLYLQNEINAGKYSYEDLCKMEGKVLDTRMSDLRIYEGRVPTLRSQRDGVLYVRNGSIYSLTGHEALLLQGFLVNMRIRSLMLSLTSIF